MNLSNEELRTAISDATSRVCGTSYASSANITIVGDMNKEHLQNLLDEQLRRAKERPQ